MKNAKPNSRRDFLVAAGLGTAGAVAAVGAAAGRTGKAKGAVAAKETKGYHDSEHIQKYYKTTLV